MNKLTEMTTDYLKYCKDQKRLDSKTIKAYRIDLNQFNNYLEDTNIFIPSVTDIENYLSHLHHNYTPKTVKRKIASIKALYHYLEYEDLIAVNPFNKIHTKFRQPHTLPKTIPLYIIEKLLSEMYHQYNLVSTSYQKKKTLQNIAVVEMLFSTGIRISELCNLKNKDVNLHDGTLLIYGKGSKERLLQIGNTDVLQLVNGIIKPAVFGSEKPAVF